MCFSASASFSVAAALVPVGAYCVFAAQQIGARWRPLALYPVAFSVQQAVEGVVWLGLNAGDQALVMSASRGFLFFSHLFWLIWVPYSIYSLEDAGWRRRLLVCLIGLGAVFGVSVYLPVLLLPDWLTVEQLQHSLVYKTVLIHDGHISRAVLRGLYAFIIVSALFLASARALQIFGWIIFASFALTALVFPHALISVWCYFAAISSAYLLMAFAHEHRRVVNST